MVSKTIGALRLGSSNLPLGVPNGRKEPVQPLFCMACHPNVNARLRETIVF